MNRDTPDYVVLYNNGEGTQAGREAATLLLAHCVMQSGYWEEGAAVSLVKSRLRVLDTEPDKEKASVTIAGMKVTPFLPNDARTGGDAPQPN